MPTDRMVCPRCGWSEHDPVPPPPNNARSVRGEGFVIEREGGGFAIDARHGGQGFAMMTCARCGEVMSVGLPGLPDTKGPDGPERRKS